MSVLKKSQEEPSPSNVITLDAEVFESEQDSIFKWSHEAVLLLIAEYQKQEEKVTLGKMSQKRMWESISGVLSNHGYDVNGSQCQSKFNGMKRTFRSIKDHNSKSGNNPRFWPYTEVMESLLEEKSFINTIATTSNQTHTESENNDVLDNCNSSVNFGSSNPRKRKIYDIAEAILESRRIAEENKLKRHQQTLELQAKTRRVAEENKRKRHQQTMDQRDKLLNALNKLINKLPEFKKFAVARDINVNEVIRGVIAALTVASSSNDFCYVSTNIEDMDKNNQIKTGLQRIAILHGIITILTELIDLNSSESEEDDFDDLIDLTSSSESEEDERKHIMYAIERRKTLRLKHYMENIVPVYNDQLFESHFRISKSTFEYILTIIAPKLRRTHAGQPMISPEMQFLIATWRMTTPDSYSSICEKFNVSRATALSATRRVITALYDLAPTIIKWPSDDNVNEVWTGFKTISGFPKVIGTIGNIHINIPAPRVQPESYMNRKGHYSVQLQAVCNHEAYFTDCFAGYPGSMNDQQVFQSSELQQWLGDSEKFPDNCYILGNSYELNQNIIVPYYDNEHLTSKQKNFNFCHASARVAIKKAFGLLKTRFYSIKNVLAMDRCDLIPTFIIACCVIHNICLSRGDNIDIEEINETEDNNSVHQDFELFEQAAIVKRDLICEKLLMQNIYCT
ncbi:uncharacterized protein [Anoplolepis gracilipes]|uniref:uncharacterized protein n=1 Tax=Anoplolepis gracilipes TaxID=354296 RepID=UPI003B9EBE06